MESSTGHLAPEVFLLNQMFFLVRGKGQNKCDTHGFCYSLVYVTRFIGKMCLLLKTLADWKTSGSATSGTTNGHFCPEDEIAGDHVEAEAVRRRHSTLLPFSPSNPEPHL